LSYDKTLQQESRAAVRKPRDVEAIFFLFKVRQPHKLKYLTKQDRLCLKADLNTNLH